MSEPNDSMLLAMTNDALREAMNRAGDNAWFLRQTVQVTLSAPPAVTTMPTVVRRLYRLERTSVPGTYVDWTLVRHDDSGNMVILPECGDTVLAHHMALPTDLAALSDPTVFPWQHEELIVVSVQLRIAQNDGSEPLISLLAGRKERLMRVFLRDCLFYERQRAETITTALSREEWSTQVGRLALP